MQRNLSDENAAQKNPIERTGPTPLPMHLMAGMNVAGDDGLSLSMIEGVKKYRAHPFFRQLAPLPVVWQAGEVTLSFCAGASLPRRDDKPSVLIVPSMINRSTVLDILEERSFVRWLASKGADVFLLDWGMPVNDPGQQSMASIIEERLLLAVAYVADKNNAPVHCVGYCMGGTLLAQAAMRDAGHMAALCFLAVPWDFHAGDKRLAGQVALGTPAAMQMMATENKLPARWVQSVFAVVNSDRVAQKFSKFAMLDDESFEARLFVAVEDWLNGGLDLPEAVGRECLIDWYGKNSLQEQYKSRTLGRPSLVVSPQRDRLVPVESALALCAHLSSYETLTPSCGHVGMMTGRNAEQEVWLPVLEWLFHCA
ncbi:MAG: alpha/beta hydrolase [Rhodospirillales bacterium]|nr:alpha/beta hydrolase [Rhodospirillales bacterium]